MRHFSSPLVCLLFLLLSAVFAAAQTPTPTPAPSPTPTPPPRSPNGPFWRAELPGGTFVVAIRNILAVSSHQYYVDGAAQVDEVNVSTAGNMQVRFYFIETNPSQGVSETGDLVTEVVERAMAETEDEVPGMESWRKVVKNYPTTTHAGTVEYRMASKADLQRLFKNVDDAWRLNRESVFRTKKEAQ